MHRITFLPWYRKGYGLTQTYRHAHIDFPFLVLKGLRPHTDMHRITFLPWYRKGYGLTQTHWHAQNNFPSLVLKEFRLYPDTQACTD